MTSSASRCSSTTMARRPTARAPAAPARTSTTPARSPTGIGIPHYVLDYESRFKEAVIDRFAESYVAGETPVPCVDCNMAIKFQRPARHRARAWRQGAGDRPLRRLARAAGRRPRALPRAEEERDQSYFLFATTPRAARPAALSARRPDQGARRASSRARFGLAVADKHDSQDICFVPTGRYTDVIERLKPGAAAPGDDRRSRRQGARARTTASSISPSASGAASRSRPASRSTWCGSMPTRRRVVVGPREALTHAADRAARRQLDRRGRARSRCSTAAGIEVFVKVRSTRPPQPAWLSRQRRRRRDRTGRRRGRRVARPGLRVLRRRRGPGARARRRLHPRRAQRPHARGSATGRSALIARRAHGRGRDGGRRSTGTRSRRPMRAGRRSTTSCSARCSSAAGRPRSRRPSACRPGGGRILEVGVGTGISLPDLQRAPTASSASTSRRRCCARRRSASPSTGLTNVEALAVMDAKHLALPDASFDVVVAQYVITAVPDPEATLDEFARVLKPGGEIILVNHLGAESGLSPRLRAGLRADRAPARLAPGISLGAADATGPTRRRRPADRAPADAAARAFLADPLRQALTPR